MTTGIKFEPTWESLRQYTIPAWYEDGKFGIFIHWGVYAVPAFANEWYPRNMYIQGSAEYEHHVKTYGPHTEFGYKDFIPLFRAEQFDPAAWAELFREAGARFVVPVAEHHDGFAMYDCSTSRWTSVHMGPQRDIVGELAQAVRERGMVFGVSTHRAEHWWFMNGGRNFASDVQDPAYDDFYGPAVQHEDCDGTQQNTPSLTSQPYPERGVPGRLAGAHVRAGRQVPAAARLVRLVDRPRRLPGVPQALCRVLLQPRRWSGARAWPSTTSMSPMPEGTAVLDVERGQLSDIRPLLWQNDTSVSKNSWSYVVPQDYKTAESLIQDLVDVVSKNGALLLNIGPRATARSPSRSRRSCARSGAGWRSTARRSTARGRGRVYGEGPTEVQRGRVHRHEACALHAGRLPLHDQGRRALRHLPGLARRDGDDPVAGRRIAVGDQCRHRRRAARCARAARLARRH